jgi:hypothetical protein
VRESKKKHKDHDETGIKENKRASKNKKTCTYIGKLTNSGSHRKRSSVELTIQVIDPAFGIGELLPEFFSFLVASSLGFADLSKLIDALYRYV